jgi:predicted metal-dependent peptidase
MEDAEQDHTKDSLEGGKEKSRGKRSLVQDFQKGKFDWKSLLRRFVMENTDPSRTWNRPNIHAISAGYDAPGTRIDDESNAPKVVVAVDCSGSISNQTVTTFISYILDVARQYDMYDIRILLYADRVFADLPLTPDTARKLPTQLKNVKFESGGNNENCIKKYLLEKHKLKKVAGFMLMTDGYVDSSATYPESEKGRLFLVIDGGTDQILKKHGDVKIINLPGAR